MMLNHCSFSTARQIVRDNYGGDENILCEPMVQCNGYVWYIDNVTLDAIAMYDVMSETLIIDVEE